MGSERIEAARRVVLGQRQLPSFEWSICELSTPRIKKKASTSNAPSRPAVTTPAGPVKVLARAPLAGSMRHLTVESGTLSKLWDGRRRDAGAFRRSREADAGAVLRQRGRHVQPAALLAPVVRHHQ